MSAIFANASSPKIGLSAGARLPTYRRMTFLAATSCPVQPAGRLAGAGGATDGAAGGGGGTTARGGTGRAGGRVGGGGGRAGGRRGGGGRRDRRWRDGRDGGGARRGGRRARGGRWPVRPLRGCGGSARGDGRGEAGKPRYAGDAQEPPAA